MQKNQGFLRKVRLYLLLIFGLGLLGCSVFKQGEEPVVNYKTYRLTIDRLPGSDESGLVTALNGAVIVSIDRMLLIQEGFTETQERINLLIRVNDEAAFQRIITRLSDSGIRVRNGALQNN